MLIMCGAPNDKARNHEENIDTDFSEFSKWVEKQPEVNAIEMKIVGGRMKCYDRKCGEESQSLDVAYHACPSDTASCRPRPD
jgi:hypothetical protein